MTNHFFDVGANTGQTFGAYLSQLPEYNGWTVWCFEPSPRHFTALLNESKAFSDRYKIKVCPFGLADKTAACTIFEKTDPQGDSLSETLTMGYGIVPNEHHGYDVMATVYSAADFILSHTAPDDRIVLKLNCEGAEFPIIRNLLTSREALKRCSLLLVAWHMTEPNSEAHRLTAELLSAGANIKQWMGQPE